MSVAQWFVIALNVCAFIAMVTAFVVVGKDDVKREEKQGDADFPPLDYRQYRKI